MSSTIVHLGIGPETRLTAEAVATPFGTFYVNVREKGPDYGYADVSMSFGTMADAEAVAAAINAAAPASRGKYASVK